MSTTPEPIVTGGQAVYVEATMPGGGVIVAATPPEVYGAAPEADAEAEPG